MNEAGVAVRTVESRMASRVARKSLRWPTSSLALGCLWAAVPLAAQSRSVAVTITEGTNLAADLSPDGRTIAMDLLGRIWTVPAVGGRATPLTDELGDARQPAWSPDGRRIAFQSYRDGTWHVWSVAADGSGLRRHSTGEYDHREPAWSPDGRSLIVASDRAGNYDVWRLDIATGEVEQLTDDPADDFGPHVRGDGAIVFVTTRRSGPGIWLLDRGVATPWARVDGQVAAPAFSKDGRTVTFNLFSNNQSRLMVANQGEEPRPVSEPGGDAFPFRASWLGPGDLLYTGDGQLRRVALDGTSNGAVPFEARLEFTRPSYRRAVPRFDDIAPVPVRGIASPTIAPDGRSFVFAALGDLWSLADGAVTRLTDSPAVETDPQFARDGRHLVYASDLGGTMDLWLRDMATGATRPLTANTGGAALPAWTPDGTQVVFQVQRGLGTEIQAVAVATGAVSVIRRNLFQPSRVSFSPDGRVLAVTALKANSTKYREGRNDLLLLDATGGGDRWVTLPGGRGIGARGIDGPAWSPDGRQLAFIMDGLLWRMPVTPNGTPAGPPIRLSNELANSVSWTRDATTIGYQATDGLRAVAVATGAVTPYSVPLTWRRSNPKGRIVIHAGRLWDGHGDRARANVDIVVVGHRIAQVVPHRAALHTGRVVDASAQTVLPGLADAHAHLGFGTGEALGRTWLAYGVTTIRDPASDPFQIRERREAVESGRRVGPRELATGRIFDGERIYYGFNNAIAAGGQLELELARAAELRFDLIKTYVRLPDVVQRRIVEVAHRHGIPVSSHELYPAVAYGTDHVEHIRGTSRRGYSPKVTALYRSYQDVTALLTSSGMSITPTIGIQGGFAALVAKDPSLLDDPRLLIAYGPEYVANLKRPASVSGPFAPNLAGIASQGETVRRVVRGGGRVIAGTDAPIVPYGLSLLTELQHYVEGGLTPVEALKTATSGFAAAMGLEAELGSVAPGRLADLTIVEGDPLERIADLRRTWGVIKNGRVYRLGELLATARPAGPP
ncbi:MAG: amidohydrolase family protein [Gemmatimonadetes bacterium]|nr:amidohydrolase family protein [Gemmatimonadota bacterium]